MFRLVFSSLIKSAYSVSLPLRLSSRLPGEEPRQPPHGHHPARPLVQEQVHQADLPGRRRHGETNNFRPLLCMNTRDTNHFHLLVLWRWRCCCLQVIMSLVTFASLQLFSSQYRPLLMSQPRLTLLSLLCFLCLFLSHQFLCGYQQPSTPAPKVINGLLQHVVTQKPCVCSHDVK